MASLVANIGKTGIANGNIDFLTDTIRAALLDNTTTADTDPDADNLGAYATLGRIAGTTDQTLASKAITTNDTNDRAEIDAADIAFTAVPGGSTAQGVLIFKFVTNDAGSTPIAFLEFASPITTNGGDINVAFAATGLLHLT